jgi:hypothetical protein
VDPQEEERDCDARNENAAGEKVLQVHTRLRGVDNEAIEQGADSRERDAGSPEHQVWPGGEEDEIEHEKNVGCGKPGKTKNAPKEQTHPACPVGSRQQHRADEAGERAEEVNDGSHVEII